VYLGGRVAEELVFGDVSTGAQNDLQLATGLARHMVTQYGMSEQLGLATFESGAGGALYAVPPSQRSEYSERTAQKIDADIARLLGEAHERVRATLRERRRLLDALAHALLVRETVDREALDALLRQEQATATPRELATRQG
jgi:cell division protease FtsH